MSRISQNVSHAIPIQEQNAINAEEATPAFQMAANQIWDAVERIRQSHTLSGCNRLIDLLVFVVASTLRGEAADLKETTIGVYVFGRSPDYDPKVDTIVRSQAWRLRAKLRRYYASEGTDDPVVISIPTGHYVPTFRLRDDRSTAE